MAARVEGGQQMVGGFGGESHWVATPHVRRAPRYVARPSLVLLDALGAEGLPVIPAIRSVADQARRALFDVSVVRGVDDGLAFLDGVRSESSVVVLPIYLTPTRELSLAESLALWEAPATLSAQFTRRRHLVIAVAMRAPAALLTACVSQGAVGLQDVGDLELALNSLRQQIERAGADGSYTAATLRSFIDPPPLPQHFLRLLNLTSAERRVLIAMMHGWSASDVANSLVVSLSTVRTHIRSILSKLGVSTQLGAVAIGFGIDARGLRVEEKP